MLYLFDLLERVAFRCCPDSPAAMFLSIGASSSSERKAPALSNEPVALFPRCSQWPRPAPRASLPGEDDILKGTAPHPRQRSCFPGSDYIRFMIHPGTDPDCGIVVPAGALRVTLRGQIRAVMARPPISSSPGKPSPLVSIYLYRRPRETSPVRRAAHALPIGPRDSHCPAPVKYRRPREGVSSSPGKGPPGTSSFPGSFIVVCGKDCRLRRERIVSFQGRHIVAPGKAYRRLRESLVVSPGKPGAFLPANLAVLSLVSGSLPVVVLCWL